MKTSEYSLDSKVKVLFVEDDRAEQMAYERWVKENEAPHNYQFASSLAEAKEILGKDGFDVIIADLNLKDGLAFDLLKEDPGAPLIIITGRGSEEIAANALQTGVCDYLIKDIDKKYFNILALSIENAILHYHTAQKQKQAEGELAHIKKEFKDFSYVISHDLNAPLRGIQSLASWLADDYAEQLGSEGQEQLNLLKDRVRHMQDLLNGVLRYSRLTRIEEEKTSIQLDALLKEMLEKIEKPDTLELVVAEDLPVVHAGVLKLKTSLEELTKNAIAAASAVKGKVEISAKSLPGWWNILIRDNGPGIPEDQHERIFTMFRKLEADKDSKSAGVGIGLTIAQKASELMAGHLRLESKPGEGTCLTLCIPKNDGKKKELP